jgi:transcriptional regulator with XRE-family HTH domain
MAEQGPAESSVGARGADGVAKAPLGAKPQHDIGRRLRQRREARGLSLRALAERVGVTASLLSQIETGQVNPSVDTLFALAEGLQMSVAEFFSSDASAGPRGHAASAAPQSRSLPVVHRPARSRIELEHGVVWESLLPVEEPGLEWMVIHYPPGAMSSAKLQRHGGRDYGLVVSGQLTIRLGFSEYVLGPGDSIAYDASTPHQLRNDGHTPVEAVWLVLDRHAVV